MSVRRWFSNAAAKIIWGYPRQIVLGRGLVLVGEGERDGRPFVLFAPQRTPGQIGATLDPRIHQATRRDTVVWLDGPAFMTINAFRRAEALRVRTNLKEQST
jgi:hypothetical protein